MADKKTSWGTTIRTIIFSILLGGASGVLATALTTSYLSNYAIQLGELTTPLRLAQERPRALPSTFEEAVALTRERLFPATVQFYGPTAGDGPHLPQDAQFQGAALTSDGWILTTGDPAFAWSRMRVHVGGDLLPVERAVSDPVTGVTFVRVNADDLPVLAFGGGLDVRAGDQLFGISAQDALLSTGVEAVRFGNAVVRSADEPSRRLLLNTSRPMDAGSPVANLGGELIGVTTGERAEDGQPIVLPLDTILPSFRSLLRDDAITRAYLGVNVIDLTHTVGLPAVHERSDHGAYIPSANALLVGGPAQAAGLQAGDIITAVDGQLVNGRRTLDERLMGYNAGDQILLTIDRDGEEHELSVTLDEQPRLAP